MIAVIYAHRCEEVNLSVVLSQVFLVHSCFSSGCVMLLSSKKSAIVSVLSLKIVKASLPFFFPALLRPRSGDCGRRN